MKINGKIKIAKLHVLYNNYCIGTHVLYNNHCIGTQTGFMLKRTEFNYVISFFQIEARRHLVIDQISRYQLIVIPWWEKGP